MKAGLIQKYWKERKNKAKPKELIRELESKKKDLSPKSMGAIPKPKNKKSWKDIEFSFLSYTNFSVKKQTFFAKRLSFLIRSGVPMLESMHVLKAQSTGKSETKILEKVMGDIANGQTLSASLGKFKNVFGNFAINVIKAGEASGTLIDNLNYLADELKKRQILRKKIKSALLYPAIITVATLGITGFLTVYIFPKIMPIFSSMNVKLPFTTRAIMWFSITIRDHGLWIFLGLVLVVIGLILLNKFSPKIRHFYDGLSLKLPVFGRIVLNYNLTNTMRTMGILLKSSMTLTEALIITSETTENLLYKKALKNISTEVMRGRSPALMIEQYPKLFPSMTTHLIAIGEKSGNLSNTFVYLSEYYEHEFDEQTKNLSSTIEPILMIIMGVLVGFVAISVITPIYELTSSIGK